ncbi:MAG TPA: DUF86 domain-containing protein [Methanoregula sp.]|nr:DUF86 domain-containing protein [Methanoregula sp.]
MAYIHRVFPVVTVNLPVKKIREEHPDIAAKKIPADARAAHPKIAWREMTGMRNILTHACFQNEYRNAVPDGNKTNTSQEES